MDKPISFVIGQTSLGKLVKIPLSRDNKDLEVFIEEFSLTEQTDIFCMTEYLTSRSEKRTAEFLEAVLTKSIFEIGYQKFKQGLFDELLTEKKLPTSSARIIYGRSLCHIAYHE